MSILKLDAQVIQDYDTGTGAISFKLQVERQFPPYCETRTISATDHRSLITSAARSRSDFESTLRKLVGVWPNDSAVIGGWYEIYLLLSS